MTREHRIWCGIRKRCENPKASHYADYGGRGIHLAPEFQTFKGFYAEVGPCPPGFTLDRIKNELGYEPGNIRWASHITQSRNKRNNRLITLNGKTQCVSAWAEELGLSQVGVRMRLHRGWSIEEALTSPIPTKDLNSGVREATPHEKLVAKRIFDTALRYGKIKSQPCEKCGDLKTQGHHTDYSKPLDVMWLCSQHHHDIHKNYTVIIP